MNLIYDVSCAEVQFWFWFCSSDGFENYEVDRCEFTSTELKDIEFIRSSYYNKLELFRFSSSLGKFVGYTDYGIKQAEYRNSQTSLLEAMKAQKETYCLNNVGNEYRNALSKSGECLC
ncbi:hypothetical protein ILYODFUR_036690 [Ilyodon furcidens]|uniref:MHC class II beta chain N-terminal domain-containing protein n=1 Tax=Ilyodon furcidens TaxID=33524 RepID=A0ABV0V015_9TELE